MIKELELTPEEIGDCLDLEIEATYPCSEGGVVSTVSVDKLLEAQLAKALVWFKEMVKGMKNPYPQPYANSAIEECQRVAWASCQSYLLEKMKEGKDEYTRIKDFA